MKNNLTVLVHIFLILIYNVYFTEIRFYLVYISTEDLPREKFD
jgi:hypothetical protein